MVTDPIADMITRIRNGGRARLRRVQLPGSKLKQEVARVLKENGFISDYSDDQATKPTLTIDLRYGDGTLPIIESIQRVSKPGRRIYVGHGDIPKVRNGLGIAIMSTPKGVMADQQAREANLGGEVLVEVW